MAVETPTSLHGKLMKSPQVLQVAHGASTYINGSPADLGCGPHIQFSSKSCSYLFLRHISTAEDIALYNTRDSERATYLGSLSIPLSD